MAKQDTEALSRKKASQPVEKEGAEAAPWNVGWIDRIYNNTNRDWYIKSVDDRFNGKLKRDGGGEEIELDGGQWHRLRSNTLYNCEWCGIPWYYNGQHYKRLSADRQHFVEVFTSSIDRKNWMYYASERGREVARQQAPGDAPFHTWLRIEDDGCALYIVNDAGEIVDTLKQIAKQVGEWVEATVKEFANKILKAAIGALGI
jgi:hypothetical protein